MRIDKGHICKNCCYYMNDDGDTMAYCCIEPLYTEVKPNHPACESYASDTEDDYVYDNTNYRKDIFYDEEDDSLNDMEF